MTKTAPAKLHLKFTVLRQAPSDGGNSCERKALRQFMQTGETIVGDRYYGLAYGFLEELRKLGISFIFRIRNKPRLENRRGTSSNGSGPRGRCHLAGHGSIGRQMAG